MKFYKPTSLPSLFQFIETVENKKYFLAGGTDINVQIKNGMIKDGTVIFINHLQELKGIRKVNNDIIIGALTSYQDILKSDLIKSHLPWFGKSLRFFASPQLQSMATIGGNIANGSPTADVLPLLLVLDARLKIMAKSKIREVPCNEFFTGYKKNILKRNELIGAVMIPMNAEQDYQIYYNKVASRRALTIAKLALAGMMKIKGGKIEQIKLGAGALNEYPRRLKSVEEYLTGKQIDRIEVLGIEDILKSEITPISDLRSEKEYRFQVTLNLIIDFINAQKNN